MRNTISPILHSTLLISLMLTVTISYAQYGTFDFNDGSVQGWWFDGAYDEDGDGPFSNDFTFSWFDNVDYPTIPFNDPAGNNKGSLMMYTGGGHGINNPSATWWIMQFHSPDLSSSSTWQTANGFSVQIADAMSLGGTLYANLYIRVYDIDQSQDRYFYSGSAQPLQHYQTQSWNYLTFDWSGIPGFPANYTVREIFVNIWGVMSDLIEGGVFLDQVEPLSNPPVLSVYPLVLDFGTTITNLDFNIINVGGGTLNWNVYETPDKPWIVSISPSNGSNNAIVTVSVDRSFLSGESDSGTLWISSNGGDTYISVLIEQEPYISVTSPATDDNWQIGSEQHIQWMSSGTSGSVSIEISRNGGGSWSLMESSTGDDGDYSWTVTDPPSTNCLIRITDTDGSPSGISGDFTISEEPFLTVTSPVAEDNWQIGSQQHIQWISSGTSGSVKITITRDGGGSWDEIETNTTDDGEYLWAVTGPPSTQCRIRVTDTDGSPTGVSGWFTISEEPFISVTSPVTDDVWQMGSEQLIQWVSSGTSGSVKITITRDGGGSWNNLDNNTTDDGDYFWIVSGPATNQCRIRVTDVDGSPTGVSGWFTISEEPFIMVTSPEVGAEWQVDRENIIRWSSGGTSGSVDIQITRDNGNNWSPISNDIGDIGEYTWMVTGPASTNCMIRITDTDGAPSGTSEVFSIIPGVSADAIPNSDELAMYMLGENPSSGPFEFLCRIPTPTTATIIVFDLAGHQIQRLHDGFLDTGRWIFTWGGTSPPGLYMCRLQSTQKTISIPVLLIR